MSTEIKNSKDNLINVSETISSLKVEKSSVSEITNGSGGLTKFRSDMILKLLDNDIPTKLTEIFISTSKMMKDIAEYFEYADKISSVEGSEKNGE